MNPCPLLVLALAYGAALAATTATTTPTPTPTPAPAPARAATTEGAPPGAPPIVAPSAAAAVQPSRSRLALTLGFSHWFGPTFGSPDGYSTPALAVGVRPGVRFLELRARYTLSLSPLPLPQGGRSLVGFASLGVAFALELRVGRQALVGFVGPFALLTHTDAASVGGGLGLEGGVEFLVRTGLPHDHAVGVFLAAREVFYTLPGTSDSLVSAPRREAQVDIGVVTTLF